MSKVKIDERRFSDTCDEQQLACMIILVVNQMLASNEISYGFDYELKMNHNDPMNPIRVITLNQFKK